MLIGGGEPMAHKEFGNLIKIFSENDIHTGVTANGTLLKKHMGFAQQLFMAESFS